MIHIERDLLVLVRGGGDLASGVILRLHRVGFPVVVLELPQPLAVRRAVSFAETVYEGTWTVEGVTARLVSPDQLQVALEAGLVPVLVDPGASVLANAFVTSPRKTVVVDARLTKQPPEPLPVRPLLHIGLGPGFRAGENCDAVVETRRSHTLGRVFWSGEPQSDSGQPEGDPRRVLRAPEEGVVRGVAQIGNIVEEGEVVAEVQTADRQPSSVVRSPFRGVVRGLIHDGLKVAKGTKIGDVDPRGDPSACTLVSDKALAVGGGVLEAVLSFGLRVEG
ncbi:MAG: selenium-dependent molybdenum cofactor biosynthesis protein YqeB [Chloroflexota bacterium]